MYAFAEEIVMDQFLIALIVLLLPTMTKKIEMLILKQLLFIETIYLFTSLNFSN